MLFIIWTILFFLMNSSPLPPWSTPHEICFLRNEIFISKIRDKMKDSSLLHVCPTGCCAIVTSYVSPKVTVFGKVKLESPPATTTGVFPFRDSWIVPSLSPGVTIVKLDPETACSSQKQDISLPLKISITKGAIYRNIGNIPRNSTTPIRNNTSRNLYIWW